MSVAVKSKVSLGFAASLAVLICIGWLSLTTTTKVFNAAESVSRTHEVIAALEFTQSSLLAVETAQRAYLLTGDNPFLEDFRDAELDVQGAMVRLRELTEDHPDQHRRLDELEALVAERLAGLNERLNLRQQQGPAAVTATQLTNGQQVMQRIRDGIERIHDAENLLLQDRQSSAKARSRFSQIIIILSIAATTVLGLLAVTIVHRDLRKREQAEHELQRSQQMFQRLFEDSPDAALLVGGDGQIIRCNGRAEHVFGYAHGQLSGQPIALLLPERFRGAHGEHLKRYFAAPHTRLMGQALDLFGLRRDGSEFPADITLSPFESEEGLTALAIIRDITERKRLEEERERFFNLSQDMLMIARDGYFRALNPAWETTLGFSRDDLLARPYIEFVHPDDRAATENAGAELLRNGRINHFENRYLCKDGSYRWLSWNARMHAADNLVYAAARDVTERKETEEQINELNASLQRRSAELEVANKELEAFSYSVSHDLRAPLRHVDGFVELLVKNCGSNFDAKAQRYLKIITDSARQMGMLIDDLLVFSRMSRTQMHSAEINMDALVREIVHQLEPDCANRKFEWQIAPLPRVHGDAALLRQVWFNLIENAVKYTRNCPLAHIEIGSQQNTSDPRVFFVRDNGVGFDMKYVEKLFGVFQRLHRSDEFEGTGIGLANVRRIVHRHGGRTWAEAEPGKGATFYFSMPQNNNDHDTQHVSI